MLETKQQTIIQRNVFNTKNKDFWQIIFQAIKVLFEKPSWDQNKCITHQNIAADSRLIKIQWFLWNPWCAALCPKAFGPQRICLHSKQIHNWSTPTHTEKYKFRLEQIDFIKILKPRLKLKCVQL